MADPISAAATAFAQWATGQFIAGTGITSLAAAQAVYVTAYLGAYVGLSAAVTVGLGAIAQSQVPDPEAQKITRKQTRPLRCYAVGGASRMSGPYMLWESTSNKLGVVIALCEGRLDSISRVYLNDDQVTLSGGFVQGMANEKYGSGDLVRLETRLGAATETHYSFLTADFGAEWPTTSRGDGIASLGMLAVHRSRESFARHFPNGEPIPSVVGTPVCYDWRQDTTAGGSGSQRRNDETTWGPSANPVVWMVHQEWARFGRSWTRCIEPVLADLTDEADYCDDLVSDGDGGTEVRYRVAGNYPANTEPDAVRRMILASMDGWMSVNGKGHLILKAGRYVEPTFTITGEHIEGYTWRAFQTAEESINSLVVSYVSPEHDYTEIEAGTFSNEDDITAAGRENSEPLQLTWVTSPTQAMRLARRKMTRLCAERRGTIRTGIYGLNGLGERFIRIQNPEMASMADVVVEVMNVEVDFASSQVIFDVILADETIDDDAEPPTVVVTPPVTPTPQDPSTEEPAVRPVTRDEPFPTSGTDDQVVIASFNAVLPDGKSVAITGGTVTGLTASTTYGVFWKDGTGFEVEAYPATTHMESGGWVFIGWQSTEDGSGVYPAPTVPGGYGGSGPAGDYVDLELAAATLQAALVAGSVIPAEAATFTGKGDLAEKDTAATADIVPNAVTSEGSAFTATETDIINIGTGRATVQSVARTVTGQPVTVRANFYLWAHHGDDDWDLQIVVERLVGSTTTDVYSSGDLRCLATNGDGFNIGWQTVEFTDTPPAGTVTYYVRVTSDRSTDFYKFAFRSRFMTVREFKR